PPDVDVPTGDRASAGGLPGHAAEHVTGLGVDDRETLVARRVRQRDAVPRGDDVPAHEVVIPRVSPLITPAFIGGTASGNRFAATRNLSRVPRGRPSGTPSGPSSRSSPSRGAARRTG